MSNKTKDGIEVKVGQVWQDLDKRMNGRKVYVWHVRDGKADVRGYTDHHGATGRAATISIRRMYPHSGGWKLVHDVA